MQVEYRRLEDPKGYFISEHGDVFSLHRGRFLSIQKDRYGYAYVSFGRKKKKIHRLVYSCFCGELVDGLTINHKDMDRLNNRYQNLEQITMKENIIHSLIGADPGSRCRKKLNLAQVNKIREINPVTYKDQKNVAKYFGVSDATIRGIVKGRTWKSRD